MRSASVLAISLSLAACTTTVHGTGASPEQTANEPPPSSITDTNDTNEPATRGRESDTSASAAQPELSSSAPASALVTGQYCGDYVTKVTDCSGDEATYLWLTSDGTHVFGQLCEAYGKDCAPLVDGVVSGGKITFRVVVDKTVDKTVEGSFTASSTGLVGDFRTPSGTIARSLFRVK
jgi:hypothetical protein